MSGWVLLAALAGAFLWLWGFDEVVKLVCFLWGVVDGFRFEDPPERSGAELYAFAEVVSAVFLLVVIGGLAALALWGAGISASLRATWTSLG
jgi:hypothetical protein